MKASDRGRNVLGNILVVIW